MHPRLVRASNFPSNYLFRAFVSLISLKNSFKESNLYLYIFRFFDYCFHTRYPYFLPSLISLSMINPFAKLENAENNISIPTIVELKLVAIFIYAI